MPVRLWARWGRSAAGCAREWSRPINERLRCWAFSGYKGELRRFSTWTAQGVGPFPACGISKQINPLMKRVSVFHI